MMNGIGAEHLWSLIALLGTAAAVWGAWDAWNDLRSLAATERNGRRAIARSNVRNQLLRAIVQAVWLAIGIPLMVDANGVPFTPIVCALLFTNFALMALSILETRSRLLIRRELERTDKTARDAKQEAAVATAVAIDAVERRSNS